MIVFEPIQFVHWEEIKTIYEEGIKTGNATFELHAPDWTTWDGGHLREARIIAIEDKHALGWAALSPGSGRCVYGGVAEVSVYVKAEARGNGLGKQLLKKIGGTK
jgi:L-amino acid N-acyltransferase YncA